MHNLFKLLDHFEKLEGSYKSYDLKQLIPMKDRHEGSSHS